MIMADKITSSIVATSLISVVGFCGSTQLMGITKSTETKTADPMKTMVTPLTLDPVCIFDQDGPHELSELKTAKGDNFFTCEEISSFTGYGGTIEYAKELASLKDIHGKPFFTGYDLVTFKHAGGTVEYARKFNGSTFSGKQLPMLYSLGLSLDEIVHFHDTKKPNALLVYPAFDEEGAFFHKNVVDFFKNAQLFYDVKVIVSSREEEVYDALDASLGFEYFMATGHGGETGLRG